MVTEFLQVWSLHKNAISAGYSTLNSDEYWSKYKGVTNRHPTVWNRNFKRAPVIGVICAKSRK